MQLSHAREPINGSVEFAKPATTAELYLDQRRRFHSVGIEAWFVGRRVWQMGSLLDDSLERGEMKAADTQLEQEREVLVNWSVSVWAYLSEGTGGRVPD
jgi:hypothetical protein